MCASNQFLSIHVNVLKLHVLNIFHVIFLKIDVCEIMSIAEKYLLDVYEKEIEPYIRTNKKHYFIVR